MWSNKVCDEPCASSNLLAAHKKSAFCRVFRIGQENETFITRFVAKNTVDDKLQQRQEVKAKAIGEAIDDKKMLQALSLHELMALFGQVVVDPDNQKPFILVDDEGEYDNDNPPITLL